jgi:hypothetical protein
MLGIVTPEKVEEGVRLGHGDCVAEHVDERKLMSEELVLAWPRQD